MRDFSLSAIVPEHIAQTLARPPQPRLDSFLADSENARRLGLAQAFHGVQDKRLADRCRKLGDCPHRVLQFLAVSRGDIISWRVLRYRLDCIVERKSEVQGPPHATAPGQIAATVKGYGGKPWPQGARLVETRQTAMRGYKDVLHHVESVIRVP